MPFEILILAYFCFHSPFIIKQLKALLPILFNSSIIMGWVYLIEIVLRIGGWDINMGLELHDLVHQDGHSLFHEGAAFTLDIKCIRLQRI